MSHTNLNAHQRVLLTVYGGGDYAHLIPEIEALVKTATSESIAEQADDMIEYKCGDTLILFLWRELRDDGNTSRDEYVSRMHAAIADIQTVIDGLSSNQLPDDDALPAGFVEGEFDMTEAGPRDMLEILMHDGQRATMMAVEAIRIPVYRAWRKL